jgi:hypothetical protein
MNGYLMQEQSFRRGEDCFLESFSPENNYGVVFEDDGETGYFYAVEKDPGGHGLRVLDALHIYEADSGDEEDQTNAETQTATSGSVEGASQQKPRGDSNPEAASKLLIVWAKDWKKCALIINGSCHAIFDFEAHGGYNINEFPPPNDFWTKGERKLTDELVKRYF